MLQTRAKIVDGLPGRSVQRVPFPCPYFFQIREKDIDVAAFADDVAIFIHRLKADEVLREKFQRVDTNRLRPASE